jgi:hypothetical protein
MASVPPGADGLIVEGFAFGTGTRLEQVVVLETMKQLVAARVLPGPFTLVAPFPPADTSRMTEVRLVASDAPGQMMPRQPAVSSVKWRNIAPSPLALVPVQQTLQDWTAGEHSTWTSTLDARSLVVFPQVYYPRLLDVHVNGRPVPYENMGRLVALELPAGKQSVQINFRGVPWANTLSTAGWVAALLMLAVTRRKAKAA